MHTDRYRIVVRGHLETGWSAWFDGWAISHPETEATQFESGLIDQPGLHGALQKIRDLNLPIVSVTRVTQNRE